MAGVRYLRRRDHGRIQRALLGAAVAALLGLLAAAMLKPGTTPIDRARSARLLGQMTVSQKQAERERAAEAEERARLP